jgi:hypothetical protein
MCFLLCVYRWCRCCLPRIIHRQFHCVTYFTLWIMPSCWITPYCFISQMHTEYQQPKQTGDYVCLICILKTIFTFWEYIVSLSMMLSLMFKFLYSDSLLIKLKVLWRNDNYHIFEFYLICGWRTLSFICKMLSKS